ncbi:hypothetical protein GCM10011348_39040 [Marinobacterium nitratireducens]|uniref:Uncharacterized protein n=1 Tax=Marinobacterium nitratireducens TaxID=518897 RepID=A0A917ZNC9_9GAMM|nr:hypothetical protein [Marinobacterium nitratireducens]GGO86952.1 hypothetical protein GCM10011348_39040 [Marinobacterium nitratireducens]
MKASEYSAWNPGLESDIPAEYRQLETIHRPENVFTRLADVEEIAKQAGLPPEELIAFRPERLVLHELLVRVTADIVVPEGEDETALGVNFRETADRILVELIRPEMDRITREFDELQQQAQLQVRQLLESSFFASPRTGKPRRRFSLRRLFSGSRPAPESRLHESTREKQYRIIGEFREQGIAATDPLTRAVYKSLYRVLGSIAGTSGFVGSDIDFLVRLVTRHLCNEYGSRVIGKRIGPLVRQAIRQFGLTPTVTAQKPVLISLKGASAAGKSSLRPMLTKVMAELGIQPGGYGTISPDIWRRQLLDYDSLGEAYKYAGRLTSKEVAIVDRKLDYYIRAKARHRQSIPHLLVDRFRFDSFSTESLARILHSTYASYVDTMLMYFVITPPEETVLRGWERGLKVGRYKAVEDFLGHSVEAYTGIPKLFFKWMSYQKPTFRYEFLDNSVPKGTYPKTIAFGTQAEMSIVDPLAFIEIERYQKINVKARVPEEVYPASAALSVQENLNFLRQCLARIPTVSFIDETTHAAFLRVNAGKPEVLDPQLLAARLSAPETADVFRALLPAICED